jgi:CDGSH-type Zn-finger protein
MSEQKVVIYKSGKIEVYGNIPIYDEDGKKLYQSEMIKLCGCTLSNILPLCDGSHKGKN